MVGFPSQVEEDEAMDEFEPLSTDCGAPKNHRGKLLGEWMDSWRIYLQWVEERAKVGVHTL